MNKPSINITKDELFSLLKDAYKNAVFGHIDLCENICQELLNEFLNQKIKLASNDCTIELGLGTNKSMSLGYLYENLQHDWTSNFFSVTTS